MQIEISGLKIEVQKKNIKNAIRIISILRDGRIAKRTIPRP